MGREVRVYELHRKMFTSSAQVPVCTLELSEDEYVTSVRVETEDTRVWVTTEVIPGILGPTGPPEPEKGPYI